MSSPPSPPLPPHIKSHYLAHKSLEDTLSRHILREASKLGIDASRGSPFAGPQPIVETEAGVELNQWVVPDDLRVNDWPLLVKKVVEHSAVGDVEPERTLEWLWSIIKDRTSVLEHHAQQSAQQQAYSYEAEKSQRTHLHKIATMWDVLKMLTIRGLSQKELVCCFLSYFKLLHAFAVELWQRCSASAITLSTCTKLTGLVVELVKDLDHQLRGLCNFGESGHHTDLLRVFVDGADEDTLENVLADYPSEERGGHGVAIARALHGFAADLGLASAGQGLQGGEMVLARGADEDAQIREMFTLVMRQHFDMMKASSGLGSPGAPHQLHSLLASMQGLVRDPTSSIPSHLIFGWSVYREIVSLFPTENIHPLAVVLPPQQRSSQAIQRLIKPARTAPLLLLLASPAPSSSPTPSPPPSRTHPASTSTLARLPAPLHLSQAQSIARLSELCMIDWPNAAGLRDQPNVPRRRDETPSPTSSPMRSSSPSPSLSSTVDFTDSFGWAEVEDEEEAASESLGWAEEEAEDLLWSIAGKERPTVFPVLEAMVDHLEATVNVEEEAEVRRVVFMRHARLRHADASGPARVTATVVPYEQEEYGVEEYEAEGYELEEYEAEEYEGRIVELDQED